jgi:HD-like signal output (HDOD) protein
MAVAATAFSREKLLTIARSFPADLQVLTQLGEMLQDVNSDLDGIAALLRRDVALSSRIVRISNSAMFGSGRIASIEEAVNRVGYGEIIKLVGTAAVGRLAERRLEFYNISASLLRDNLLFTAHACEALALAAGHDSRAAYTAGLLRPFGLMVLDRAGRGLVPEAQRFTQSSFQTYTAWEGVVFGLENGDLTGLILNEWRTPPELGRAIRAHYLARTEDYSDQLACLLNVANHLALRANRAFAGELRFWALNEDKLSGAGLTADQVASAANAAELAFEKAIAALAM